MDLLRIVFAIVVGALVLALLEWLTVWPHGVEVLLGVVAGFIVYFGWPDRRPL